jgi:hypothetical protein
VIVRSIARGHAKYLVEGILERRLREPPLPYGAPPVARRGK